MGGQCAWPSGILFVLGTLGGLCLGGSCLADEKGKYEEKGGKKPRVVRIDLDRLPPELARQLAKYVEKSDSRKEGRKGVKAYGKKKAGKKKTARQGKKHRKGKVARGKGRDESLLPPGLRNKPSNHPGRRKFLEKARAGQADSFPAKKKRKVPDGAGKKGCGDD